MSAIINGETGMPIEQEILCGAAIPITRAVLDHGIVLMHPELPPIKIHLAIETKEASIEMNGISKYAFEKIEPKHGKRTKYAIVIMEEQYEPEPKLAIPAKPKLII